MSEKYVNTVKVNTSGNSIETAILFGDKESPNRQLTRVLSELLTPKPSSLQAFNACDGIEDKFAILSGKNPEETVTMMQRDYKGEWQTSKQIKRGNIAAYVKQVIAFHAMLLKLDSHVTAYSVQLTNPEDFKKTTGGKKVKASLNDDMFNV